MILIQFLKHNGCSKSDSEFMLGQIANFCPFISRNTIVKNCTSISCIWQSIRLHYGFKSMGAHFIDFNSIKLEPGERPEDSFQRLQSFVEDNLLCSDGFIRHYGELPAEDEEISPSLENFIVLTWLRLIHKDLPGLVKQRYGTELRSQTLASIKPRSHRRWIFYWKKLHQPQKLRCYEQHSNLPSVSKISKVYCAVK